MIDASHIKEHMHVVASDGEHIGTVDRIEADATIKLTKNDSPDGNHHLIPVTWVSSVDEQVHLSKPSEHVFQNWEPV
jgi:hypothetical protein